MSLKTIIALSIITVVLFIASAYTASGITEASPSTNEVMEEITKDAEVVNPTQEIDDQEEVLEVTPKPIIKQSGRILYTQDEVRLVPAMEAICPCESGRQFHPDGSVVLGRVNPLDIGMCQINLKYHGAAADRLGYDLYTEVGNILYSNHLYAQQGAQPWYLSGACHGQS